MLLEAQRNIITRVNTGNRYGKQNEESMVTHDKGEAKVTQGLPYSSSTLRPFGILPRKEKQNWITEEMLVINEVKKKRKENQPSRYQFLRERGRNIYFDIRTQIMQPLQNKDTTRQL